jgi:hypothetical protein
MVDVAVVQFSDHRTVMGDGAARQHDGSVDQGLENAERMGHE